MSAKGDKPQTNKSGRRIQAAFNQHPAPSSARAGPKRPPKQHPSSTQAVRKQYASSTQAARE
eukprot:6458786-Lingulodinium_polyedra.AAC.1